MKPISQQTLVAVFKNIFLLHACLGRSQSTLVEMVDAIATFDNTSNTFGTNVCLFTTSNSSLPTVAPHLIPSLLSKYPTIFLNQHNYVFVKSANLATLVLLDVTGYHYEFPFRFIQKRLSQHPCYRKSAKFVILMGGTSFQRKETAVAFMTKFSILNYILVPVTNASGSMTVYTKHQFTEQEYYFRTDDRPVQQFFPDKLRNINGYKFKMHGITAYPYMVFDGEGFVYGLVPNLVKIIIRQRCNGTSSFTENEKLRSSMDGHFNIDDERLSFQHTFYFREETSIHIVCPVRSVRDFLRHLLKPFSIGIWLILVGLFTFCRVVQILFPDLYRYDLIALTFFGGGGIEYQQPFAFRIITLTLAVLVFFLSEAYNTKIISLMSLAKFYEQPQTIEELHNSDFRILSSRAGTDFFGPISDNFLSYRATLRERRRYGFRVHEHYCSTMHVGNAWIAVSQKMNNLLNTLYIVEEPLLIDKSLIQLAQHSPFFDLFEKIFGWFNDSGLWTYMLTQSKALLYKSIEETPFQEVIFFFNDLFCVWILIFVGWLISTVCFVGEIVTDTLRQRKLRRTKRFLHAARKYRIVMAWFNPR
ncbi:uncharacterized protein LOC128302827 [Anopheles moucheti]|uniref:uncharacterized protein LOC128302827 n=1 Tax=Anopheles moucheti TaxID=186751 RepID=UPI0022F11089|nr:uncharacterized protein LOC128302827 [Anopheles moucheti]